MYDIYELIQLNGLAFHGFGWLSLICLNVKRVCIPFVAPRYPLRGPQDK